MERKTIYIQGDRATAAAESPRLITGEGSHSGHVVDSRGPMRGVDPAWEK